MVKNLSLLLLVYLIEDITGKLQNGGFWTGKTPSEIPSFELIKVQQTEEPSPFKTTSEWVSDYPSKLTNSQPGLPPKQFGY